MKKLLILFLLLFTFLFIYGQKASISISHTVKFDSLSVLADSIKVTNLSQGGDTTLYGTDTTLLLDYTTGLSDYQTGSKGLVIMQNYPNPFFTQAYFNVIVPEYGYLLITVYDIVGKEITCLSANYLAGNHKFSFTSGESGLYILKASLNNHTSTIKAQSIGGNKSPEYGISYLGTESSAYNHKSNTAINSFIYTFGDQLRSTAYYQSMFNITNLIPIQDTLVQFNFHSPLPCPANFIDSRDSNIYTSVQIGAQCWMAENLAYLPAVFPSDTGSMTSPLYYVYDYQGTNVAVAKASANYPTYGVLYNWIAAVDGHSHVNNVPSGVRGICPAGWHVPSDEEWKILEAEVDSIFGYPDPEWNIEGNRGTNAGGNLKETGTIHWFSPNTGATNSSGFTALPGGYRDDFNLAFVVMKGVGVYWSTSKYYDIDAAWNRYFSWEKATVKRGASWHELGFSLRCLQD